MKRIARISTGIAVTRNGFCSLCLSSLVSLTGIFGCKYEAGIGRLPKGW